MFGGLTRLFVVAVAAGVVLVAPPAALACSGGPSAENVYSECPKQTGGTGKNTGGPAPSTKTSSQTPAVSSRTAKVIKGAGKDRRALANVAETGPARLLQSTPSDSEGATPSAVGSAFDLGSGPTALLIILAGTAVLLLGGSGLRLWHQRHR
ncbi:MAG TPA: hypothetical protein VJ716_09410 [Gaiellaceae bacterium]|nr:hypothetical protein [Gaiellaceae bacterium]